MPRADHYSFGDFVLEPAQQRVFRRGGEALALTPRLFNALLLFVQRPGELLDKDTLMRTLWADLVVEENNLSQVISALRRALGDEAQGSRFIQTVPRRGFRFVAPVSVVVVDASAASDGPASGSALPPVPVPEAVGKPRRRVAVVLAVGVAAVGGTGMWRWHRRPDDAPAHGATLAVLPFKPLGTEGRDELLELGMTDSLIARLSSVPGLAVRSTGAVLRYAGVPLDSVGAGRELGVGWVVDGTLQRRGDRFRATARLLRVVDGVAAWSGAFDERFTDVFDVQDQISERVMHALAPTLRFAGPRPVGNLVQPGGTRSSEAYQLYLNAQWRSQGGRAADIERGIALLHQALSLDPEYALAWTLLAWTHRRKLWNADAVPSEVFAPADAALQRALALVPTLAQARAGLGFHRYWLAFDWPGAERAFREALAINPHDLSAHHSLALMLLTQDRLDEGFTHLRQARELDPLSPVLPTLEASYLTSHGQLAEARMRLDRAFDISSTLWLTHVASGQLLIAERRPDEGIVALRRAVDWAPDTTRPRAVLAVELAALGRTAEAAAILDWLLARARTVYVPAIHLAAMYAGLGDASKALAALEQAYVMRDTRLIFLKDDPHWRPLRKEPRFAALKTRLRLDGFGRGLTPV